MNHREDWSPRVFHIACAQNADAATMVVLNDHGVAIRMPKSSDDRDSVNIPSVMVSKVRVAV